MAFYNYRPDIKDGNFYNIPRPLAEIVARMTERADPYRSITEDVFGPPEEEDPFDQVPGQPAFSSTPGIQMASVDPTGPLPSKSLQEAVREKYQQQLRDRARMDMQDGMDIQRSVRESVPSETVGFYDPPAYDPLSSIYTPESTPRITGRERDVLAQTIAGEIDPAYSPYSEPETRQEIAQILDTIENRYQSQDPRAYGANRVRDPETGEVLPTRLASYPDRAAVALQTGPREGQFSTWNGRDNRATAQSNLDLYGPQINDAIGDYYRGDLSPRYLGATHYLNKDAVRGRLPSWLSGYETLGKVGPHTFQRNTDIPISSLPPSERNRELAMQQARMGGTTPEPEGMSLAEIDAAIARQKERLAELQANAPPDPFLSTLENDRETQRGKALGGLPTEADRRIAGAFDMMGPEGLPDPALEGAARQEARNVQIRPVTAVGSQPGGGRFVSGLGTVPQVPVPQAEASSPITLTPAGRINAGSAVAEQPPTGAEDAISRYAVGRQLAQGARATANVPPNPSASAQAAPLAMTPDGRIDTAVTIAQEAENRQGVAEAARGLQERLNIPPGAAVANPAPTPPSANLAAPQIRAPMDLSVAGVGALGPPPPSALGPAQVPINPALDSAFSAEASMPASLDERIGQALGPPNANAQRPINPTVAVEPVEASFNPAPPAPSASAEATRVPLGPPSIGPVTAIGSQPNGSYFVGGAPAVPTAEAPNIPLGLPPLNVSAQANPSPPTPSISAAVAPTGPWANGPEQLGPPPPPVQVAGPPPAIQAPLTAPPAIPSVTAPAIPVPSGRPAVDPVPPVPSPLPPLEGPEEIADLHVSPAAGTSPAKQDGKDKDKKKSRTGQIIGGVIGGVGGALVGGVPGAVSGGYLGSRVGGWAGGRDWGGDSGGGYGGYGGGYHGGSGGYYGGYGGYGGDQGGGRYIDRGVGGAYRNR